MEKIELSDTEQSASFRFPPAAPCGKQLVTIDGLTKSFGEKQVFSDLTFQMLRGDKLAVVGVNGAGKSTLMKIIAGMQTAEQGKIQFGHNVQLSYFGQHQAQELEPEFTVLETLNNVADNMTTTEARSLLGAFLFRGDEVDKKVAVLSGGEKSRLALAKMIVQPANLLILDEPTNHLDMTSQDVLQEAMIQYDGGIIIVSHNRYFVNRFVNKVLEIRAGRGSLFEGNIDEYLAKLQQMEVGRELKSQPEEAAADKNGTDISAKAKGKALRQEQAKIRQEKSRKLAPLQKKIAASEQEIEALEARKKELETRMADPELYKDETAFAECSREYKAVERRLDREYHKWEEVQAEVEKIESEFA
jgi:ATP-binding cassette subfamily F protein 3